ncbi:hypothetical protein BDQ17DRAFT_741348 [Cyathus striatus]|nr:hypothetical protein BDQ17DRAFT_741348 [Cyathus striatus]
MLHDFGSCGQRPVSRRIHLKVLVGNEARISFRNTKWCWVAGMTLDPVDWSPDWPRRRRMCQSDIEFGKFGWAGLWRQRKVGAARSENWNPAKTELTACGGGRGSCLAVIEMRPGPSLPGPLESSSLPSCNCLKIIRLFETSSTVAGLSAATLILLLFFSGRTRLLSFLYFNMDGNNVAQFCGITGASTRKSF